MTTAPPKSDRHDLLTTAELARRWRLAPRTLQRWRNFSFGPAWMRLGGRIYYRLSDVEAFEARQSFTPE